MTRLKYIFLLSLLGSFFQVAGAAEYVPVSFPSGDETISARWLAPEGGGPFPTVILIHEWWGVNAWVEGRGRSLVKEGFAVLAVDLYRGKSTSDPEEAHELMRGLPEDRALRDLSAAVNYLKQNSQVKSKSIGVLGWCMGGGFAIKLAMAKSDVASCVVYYGSLPTDKDALSKINAPILAFFGAEDRGISVEAIRHFEGMLRDLGKTVTTRIYEQAGHAFLNETRPSYNKTAAEDSWKRTRTFLSNTLNSQ